MQIQSDSLELARARFEAELVSELDEGGAESTAFEDLDLAELPEPLADHSPADGFLAKPYSEGLLYKMVSHVMDSKREAGS